MALWLGYGVLRRRGLDGGRRRSLATLALLLLTVAPALPGVADARGPRPRAVTAGLAAWASGRPLLAAVLFGVAGYLKPPNVLMAAPLGLEPLLPPRGERFPGGARPAAGRGAAARARSSP